MVLGNFNLSGSIPFQFNVWAKAYLAYNCHQNFNVNFVSHKNDIHIHLSQWQYWWWFWFALIWSLYFLVILRVFLKKTENFNITLNTSLRSHGKWGDFLVALIPLSWCGNILINSNFILRMIEWQNESSLFVIRIQGKQWYWSYKYNSDTNYRLQNVFINVGNNNWFKTVSASNVYFNTQNSILTFIYDLEFKKNYKIGLNSSYKNKTGLTLSTMNSNFSLNDEFFKNKNSKFNTTFSYYIYLNNLKNLLNTEKKELELFGFSNKFNSFKIINKDSISLDLINKDLINYNLFYNIKKKNKFDSSFNSFYTFKKNQNNLNLFNTSLNNSYITNLENSTLNDVEDFEKNLRINKNNFPVKLIKGTLNKQNISSLSKNEVINKKLFLSYRIKNSDVTLKTALAEQFWGFRQKKYKKLRSFVFSQNNKFSNSTYTNIGNFTNDNFDKYSLYSNFKNNKYRSESLSSSVTNRLLRTKRTLVLPAHINITLITNSYDVVHSWFVPGLGLKIDCVPGRSTHHTLYIDNVGFYYGQCAEICGRYHHHMPIRVCALNYEHFLLWWQTKGLPRMYRSKSFYSNKSLLLNKFKH